MEAYGAQGSWDPRKKSGDLPFKDSPVMPMVAIDVIIRSCLKD